MAWGRIDDAFDDHPKVLALLEMEGAASAIGLWTLCFTWAHRNTRRKGKTPGLIPASLPRRFFGPEARSMAALLVEVGLWDEDEDGGWMIHDFADYLPGKEVSEARSAAGKKGAAKRWGGKGPKPDDKAMADAKQDGGKPMAPPSQADSNLPSDDGSEPSNDGNAIASDGSRAGARRVWAGVGSEGSDRTSVKTANDPAAPAEADASGDGVLIQLGAVQKKPTFQPGSDQDPAFVAFWKAYPRKVDKGHARAAWVKAVKRADPQAIVAAAERFRDNPMRQARGTEYTPHPTTWLNGERWNDEAATSNDDHWRWDAVQEVAPREFNHR